MEHFTVAKYLIHRLESLGSGHMFGVPGDYVLDFMDRVNESSIRFVGNCNELNSGYAADAYARLKGIGAVCVTYGVGGLSAVNAAAGAYAERLPVVFISGAPHSRQRLAGTLMHHISNGYQMQLDMYRHVTVDAAQLTDPVSAPQQIDRVLGHAITNKQPVYIEIPVDMVDAPCRAPEPLTFEQPRRSDPKVLEECVAEVAALVNGAQHPIILAGVELNRFKQAEALLKLVEKIQVPYATTIDGKSALPEMHPQFMGVYMGAMSREAVIEQLENSDALLVVGTMMTDINTGGFTAHLPERRIVQANLDRVRIGHHHYDEVWLGDFLASLTKALKPRTYACSHPANPHHSHGEYTAVPEQPLRVGRLFDRINRFIDDQTIVIAETGDAMFSGAELYVEQPENFISQAFYLSIGYCVPATLGVCLARPQQRVILLEGDGAFQMTAQEISTLLRHGCHPVIFILNNDGYVVERLIHDGPYNDIQQWNYHLLPQAFGGDAIALEVRTEGELEQALAAADSSPGKLVFINVHLPRDEGSPALDRLAAALRKLQVKD